MLKNVFLDLGGSNFQDTDEKLGSIVLEGFNMNVTDIGKRYKDVNGLGILYPAKSVELFMQARTLYCLGLFMSTVIVCRSTAEYIMQEVFCEKVSLRSNKKLCDFIIDSFDLRKIVNNYLKKNGIISKIIADKFNKLYDLGNGYVHPKTKQQINPQQDALEALVVLKNLILGLKNVLNDYDISEGVLVKKSI